MIELLFFAAAGCLLGAFTGLIPGIHVNTVSLFALSLAWLGGAEAAALIIAMGVAHSFFDFVPSVLLGAPDSSTYLGVLPGHRLLLEGRGMEAVQLTVAGGLFGGIASLLLAPFFMRFVSTLYSSFLWLVPVALSLALASLVLLEKKGKKRHALFIVGLSSALGFSALRAAPLKNGLVPMVIGFFAMSTVLLSAITKTALKRQKTSETALDKKSVLEGSILSVAGASAVSVLPGIGPGQAAFLVKKAVGKMGTKAYLSMLGGINTSNIVLSLAVLLAAGKARTGVAAALGELGVLEPESLLLFCGASLMAICFSVLTACTAAKFLLEKIYVYPYQKISGGVFALLCGIVFLLSGAMGLAFSLVACCIGLAAVTSGVRRTHCMAFLLFPTLLFYLGL